MTDILTQFKDLGISASCHYADDTGGEWRYGDRDKRSALRLFDDNPASQDAMREIAAGFLWSLKMDRPES